MYDIYFWATPNGYKILLFGEEASLSYKINPVNLEESEQTDPAFLGISPNGKIPALVDYAPQFGLVPISVFESGAILLYLAEKTRQFIPADVTGRVEVLQWLFWQMAGLGPIMEENHHFSYDAPEENPYVIERYRRETSRLYAVLDKRLADRAFVAGDEYTIADMASYPWNVSHVHQGHVLEDFPHLKRWFEDIVARPATIRAYLRGEEIENASAAHDRSRNYSDVRKRALFQAARMAPS